MDYGTLNVYLFQGEPGPEISDVNEKVKSIWRAVGRRGFVLSGKP